MSLLSQTCTQAARLMSDSYEASLPFTARVGLCLHLTLCRQCRRYHRQLRLMRAIFGDYPDHLPAAPLPDEFRRQLVRRLEKGE